MKVKHLLAMNHRHTLSSTHLSASIPTKLSLVHGTVSVDDEIVFKSLGKVYASNSTSHKASIPSYKKIEGK